MSSPEPTDAELIRGSLEDPERFEGVFERHYERVRRFAQRIVGREAGEEIASQTFLIAFQRRTSYDVSYASAAAWLFGIAYNVARHHLRSERSQAELLARIPREREAEEPLDVEALEAVRLAPFVIEALKELPEERRIVFVMVALGELTYQETADVLGIPVGSVRSRVHRARATIRELLMNEKEIPGVGQGEMAHRLEAGEDPKPDG